MNKTIAACFRDVALEPIIWIDSPRSKLRGTGVKRSSPKVIIDPVKDSFYFFARLPCSRATGNRSEAELTESNALAGIQKIEIKYKRFIIAPENLLTVYKFH